MHPNDTPDRAYLLSILRYDPDTGFLYWKARDNSMFQAGSGQKSADHLCNQWNSRFAGKRAFTSATTKGYLRGTINNVFYYAHRIIWKMQTGVEADDVDHHDNDPSNNAWDNLFSVTRSYNLAKQPRWTGSR